MKQEKEEDRIKLSEEIFRIALETDCHRMTREDHLRVVENLKKQTMNKKYIGPTVDSDEDVEYELVASGPVNYEKPDFIRNWEEKLDTNIIAEVDEKTFIADLKCAGYQIKTLE